MTTEASRKLSISGSITDTVIIYLFFFCLDEIVFY